MVSLKEIKKTLKELKTLREQKEYLEGILKAVKDDKILAKAVEVFLNEVTRMIEQEKRDIPHKTIDDVLSLVKGPEEEEELKLPEKSVKEVLRETRDYHTSEVKEVKGEAYVPAPKGVSYSPSSTSGVSYSGSRQDRIESVRAYMRDVKRMTDNFSSTVFESWKGTEQMADLYDLVENTFQTSDPFEVRKTVREIMNVQDQYTSKNKDEKYLKR